MHFFMHYFLLEACDLNERTGDESKDLEKSRKRFEISKKPTVMKSLESKKTDLNKGLINEILLSKVIRKMKLENNTSHGQFSSNKNDVFTADTVNNFKTLQLLFKNSTIIDYDELYIKINQASQKYGKLFDFKEDLKKIEDDKTANSLREVLLMDKFNELKRDIESKKNLENKLRLINFSNNKKLKMQKEMVIIMICF